MSKVSLLIWSGALLLFYFAATSCGKSKKPELANITFDANAGYSMLTRDVDVAVSDSGQMKYRLLTDAWYIYDQGDSSRWFFPEGFLAKEIDSLKAIPTQLSSDTAYYFTIRDTWLFQGHVKVVNERGERFFAKTLYWDKPQEHVYSDDSVTIISGERHLTGTGFSANQDFTLYSIYNNSGVTVVEEDNQ